MNEVKIYVISRDGEPVAAFLTPHAASVFLVQQPLTDRGDGYRSRYKLKPLVLHGALEDKGVPDAQPYEG